MRMAWAGCVLAALVVLALPVVAGEPDKARKTETINIDDAPALVKATILKETEGAKVKTVVKISSGDKSTYIAAAFANNKAISLLVNPEGKLIVKNTRETIDEAEVPDAPKATIKKTAEEGQIEEIAKVTDNDAVHFEAKIVLGDKTVEIEVDLAGKLLSKKVVEEPKVEPKKAEPKETKAPEKEKE